MERVIFIKGASTRSHTKVYKFLAHNLAAEGFDVELIHQAGDHSLLEGIILKKERFMLCDHQAEYQKKGGDIFELDDYLDTQMYETYKAKIEDLEEQIRVSLEFLQENCRFGTLKKEELLNEDAEQMMTEKIADNYFFTHRLKPHMRFARSTESIDKNECYREILQGITEKYYLPTLFSHKSRILENLAVQAGRAGYEAVIYYDSWDSEVAEVLVVRELNLAIAAEKMTMDFLPCRLEPEKSSEQDIFPPKAKRLLANVRDLQEILDDIYSDILPEECLNKAEENLYQVLGNYLQNDQRENGQQT